MKNWKMNEKIIQLIEEHKTYREECYELLKELNQLQGSKMSPKEKVTLREAVIKAEEEYLRRGLFIQDLENLL